VNQHLVLSDDAATPIDPLDDVGPTVPAPHASRLHAAVPNPFNPRTRMQLDLAGDAPVTLVVYDGAGRAVRTLVDEPLAAGRYEVAWDGTTDDGRSVPSGVYFARMEAGGAPEVQKLTLLQ
jgi:flagellar hook assembly protein FlgD